MTGRVLTAVSAMALVFVLGACGGGSSGKGATATKTGTTGRAITIKDFTFAPTPLSATAGTTITVTNRDNTAHTVTADNDEFDTANIDANANATFTVPKEPGTYAYHCRIHDFMKGSIRVTG